MVEVGLTPPPPAWGLVCMCGVIMKGTDSKNATESDVVRIDVRQLYTVCQIYISSERKRRRRNRKYAAEERCRLCLVRRAQSGPISQ